MRINERDDGLPALQGRTPIVIRPPGDAATDEHEFVLWLQEVSRKMIQGKCAHVHLIPMVDEFANILIRTDPLDPLEFRLVSEALSLAPHL